MKVYIIQAGYEYENSSILACYLSRESAEKEVARIEKHKSKEPKFPGKECSDAEMERFHADNERWRRGLRGESDYDYYVIIEKDAKP